LSLWKTETSKIEEISVTKTYFLFVTIQYVAHFHMGGEEKLVVVKALQGTIVTCWLKSHVKLIKMDPSQIFKIPESLQNRPTDMFVRTLRLPDCRKWKGEIEEKIWNGYGRKKKR
jgi:hypothetical protein